MVVEGAVYDGVIRLATPIDAPDGTRLGLAVLALDHLHLTQFSQHVKAMEENATVFAGYRDADYTFLFDDQGWVISHPRLWDIRGVDRLGKPLPAYNQNTTLIESLVGRAPVNLESLDWKLGEGYHQIVDETRAGRTGIATTNNLAGVLCTRVYSPISYSTGVYAKHGIFGGVMMGTRVDKFIELMRQMSQGIGQRTAQIRSNFVWAFLGLLVFVALVAVAVARGLVRPLRRLWEAARLIGAGQLDTPIPVQGQDEIGELGRAFAEMTHSLKNTIQELERRNIDLKEAQAKLLSAERDKRKELQREVVELQKEITRTSFANLIGESPPMQKVKEEIVRVAGSSATVLILGENGTGKEIVAEAIHRNSPRRDRQFLKINCAAFNENLLESELFGHLKGSFTGATSNRKGLFESATGGSILLDEIGDMSPAMQTKLLRTVQEGEVVPLGSNHVIKVDVRILAATNQDLHLRMAEGKFREDLFHRINVISIRVPPLRERKEDILPLATFFIQRMCEREKKPWMTLEPAAEAFLKEYRWPGNVRELENAVERAVIRSLGQTLRQDDFQLSIEEKDLPCVVEGTKNAMTLEEVEKAYILSVLEKHGGNKKATAEELAIGYNTLWRKLKTYNKI
jgi:DNA-binding NtrC family response regulator